ncbi:VOC family protein [Jannaschia marina]|uniref:VOC family protein n=1 Tax=Jannaschia marina TaxID=2741674 RepID=UPI0015CC56DA|nr:VOC family protein [Jannaschia marina]
MTPRRRIALVTLVVDDYDRAIEYYVGTLGFELVEDIAQPAEDKRWIVVRPAGAEGAGLVLGRARDAGQVAAIGMQGGGRVFLFLETDDFARDYADLRAKGVTFERPPARMDYGTVAVFRDLYGNLWDLIEYDPPRA